ncbi:hypothetical protein JDV02_003422 [Purpureocillium takamizusanense]|nr:uncharacterized protein JDV02_003422 [Purpureocillium takamizusanense]UNI17044.1 hypothetical protein JDV02_003422 [Purpureocillium takamizusanense]
MYRTASATSEHRLQQQQPSPQQQQQQQQQQYSPQEPRSYSQEFVAMPVSPHGSEVSDGYARRPASRGVTSHHSTHRPSLPRAPSSVGSTYSIFPPPTKPLPPIPLKGRRTARAPSQDSFDKSSASGDRYSRSSIATSNPDTAPTQTLSYISDTQQVASGSPAARQRSIPEVVKPSKASVASTSSFDLGFDKQLVSDDKRINNNVFYLDVSPTAKILASKHGNNILKLWDLDTGAVESSIKFTSYTEAQSRSREYLIRSHAIVSETSNLVAIATRFGRTIEIWNWGKKKCIQTLDDADRWTAANTVSYGGGYSPLAIYRGDDSRIDLFTATREKKPFVKQRSIDLKQANLPFVPQYPELALSATSPLLVAAAGPRPPRAGHPPPDKETLLVAWDTNTDGYGSNKPFRVARPWQHEEISTAIPCDLRAYGSVVVSIWIPAGFRAVPVPPSRGGTGYNLVPVKVPSRYVLVWDLSANSTHTFAIPNCAACISPDCRYVAYCHASGTGIGARGCVCVLDVVDGREVWCWPDKDALAIDSGPKPGFEQFNDLSLVSELAFSADGRSLIIADRNGRIGVYNVRVME